MSESRRQWQGKRLGDSPWMDVADYGDGDFVVYRSVLQPVGAVTDGSVPQPAGAAVGATCIVCAEPATFLVLGSYRCVSHRETTVVGPVPEQPARTVQVEFNMKHYTDCIEGYCKCGGDGK